MDFYFVHSYKFCPNNESLTIGQTFYSEKFSSIIAKRQCNWFSISS